MKSVSFLLAALAALPVFAHASSFQTFNSSFNNYDLRSDAINNDGYISDVAAATDFSAPIGWGSLRHTGTPLADGSYAFSSFSGLSILIDFEVGATSYAFGLSHIISDTSGLDIYLANGAFHFGGSDTTVTTLVEGVPIGASVVFRNGNNVLLMTYDDKDSYGYAIYEVNGPSPELWTLPAFGLYGTAETAYFGTAPIPEPSSFAAIAGLGALAPTVGRRRRAA